MKNTQFRKKDFVYFTGFTKLQKDVYFICKGQIIDTIDQGKHTLYKVKIMAVADKAIAKNVAPDTENLLGKIITKKALELTKEVNAFLSPKAWIELKEKE